MTITPVGVSPGAGDASVVNADSVVYAKTHMATDTILRPTADGIESFLVLYDRTAPTVFSWTISLEANQRLVAIDAQTVAIERPRTDPAMEVSADDLAAPMVSPDVTNVSDVNVQLSVERRGSDRSTEEGRG